MQIRDPHSQSDTLFHLVVKVLLPTIAHSTSSIESLLTDALTWPS